MAKLKPYDWKKIRGLYETGETVADISEAMKAAGHKCNQQVIRNRASRDGWNRDAIIKDRVEQKRQERSRLATTTKDDKPTLDRIRAIDDEVGLRSRHVELAEKQIKIASELIARGLAGVRQLIPFNGDNRGKLKDTRGLKAQDRALLKTFIEMIDKASKQQISAARWETIAAAIGEDTASETNLTTTEIAVNVANIFSSAGFDVVDGTIIAPEKNDD